MNYLEDISEFLRKNVISIIAILIALASIGGSIMYVKINLDGIEECDKECDCLEYDDKEGETAVVSETETFEVDVKGAVKKPGVYKLEKGQNIQDALNAAGGLTTQGSTSNINLSKKLSDEMVVYVFTKEELKKKEAANEVVCEIPKCECETITVTECPTVNQPTNKDPTNEQPNTSNPADKNGKVSLNKASIEELMSLDGIGEAKAKAIVEYREKNGAFAAIEDIQKVNGIGASVYEKIKDRLTL